MSCVRWGDDRNSQIQVETIEPRNTGLYTYTHTHTSHAKQSRSIGPRRSKRGIVGRPVVVSLSRSRIRVCIRLLTSSKICKRVRPPVAIAQTNWTSHV